MAPVDRFFILLIVIKIYYDDMATSLLEICHDMLKICDAVISPDNLIVYKKSLIMIVCVELCAIFGFLSSLCYASWHYPGAILRQVHLCKQ